MAAGGSLPAQFAAVSAYYVAYKLIVRALVGCTEDERGWGRPETYVCAFVHQAMVAAISVVLFWENRDDFDSWFVRGWSGQPRARELLVMIANLAEMWTDCALYARYSGFQWDYYVHHATTFVATASFIVFEASPIGCVVLYAGLMELGGAFLNLASLAPHRLTFLLRVVVYPASRLLSTAVLAKVTYSCWAGVVRVPLVCFAPVWVLMVLNLSWSYDMIIRFAKRQQGDPWAAKKKA